MPKPINLRNKIEIRVYSNGYLSRFQQQIFSMTIENLDGNRIGIVLVCLLGIVAGAIAGVASGLALLWLFFYLLLA